LENIPKIQDSITKIVAAVKADVAQLDTRDITQLAHLHGVLKTQYERLSDAWVAFKGESYVNAANKYETAQKVAATKEYLIQTEATIMESFNTIIEAHGGRLWAETNKGRGASFHFYLPLRPESP
jgi:light-regulated signal transduction histidine kinase (bacteriophytochrome)